MLFGRVLEGNVVVRAWHPMLIFLLFDSLAGCYTPNVRMPADGGERALQKPLKIQTLVYATT